MNKSIAKFLQFGNVLNRCWSWFRELSLHWTSTMQHPRQWTWLYPWHRQAHIMTPVSRHRPTCPTCLTWRKRDKKGIEFSHDFWLNFHVLLTAWRAALTCVDPDEYFKRIEFGSLGNFPLDMQVPEGEVPWFGSASWLCKDRLSSFLRNPVVSSWS